MSDKSKQQIEWEEDMMEHLEEIYSAMEEEYERVMRERS